MFLKFFLFAITFLFISCADFERDNPEDKRSINFRPSSSSKQSSSSVTIYSSSSSSKQSSSSVTPVVSSSSSAGGTTLPSSSSTQSSSSIIINACPNVAIGNNALSCGGQIYRTVEIGDVEIGKQVWMAENLNYNVPDNDTDVCYDNDPANCAIYGRLYDWATAMTVCPNGWHLPSDEEWTTLTNFVDSATAGIKLKANSNLWLLNSSTKGTDDYGFAALPGGYIYSEGFRDINNGGDWWSSTKSSNVAAFGRGMYYTAGYVSSYGYDTRVHKLSVRCVKD